MDDYHSRYGFMTTHGRTWFVKRASDNRFLVSKPIKADDKATDDSLSLRECFLFFGHLAREKGEGEEPMLYKKRIGLKLVSQPMEKQSS